MLIYPAIDIIDGKCVRLTLGDFATSKVYNENPLNMLDSFKNQGLNFVHVVDLDGAKAGQIKQLELIKNMVLNSGLDIQVGGGIREENDIQQLFDLGVKRVVLGSICLKQPDMVKNWLKTYGKERIVLALDCTINSANEPVVKTNGWQDNSNKTLWDLLDEYNEAQYILCTDITVDGTLNGPNIDLYKTIIKRYPQLNLIASGGVGDLDDLDELSNNGIYATVVGKAIYEGKIQLWELRDKFVKKDVM